MKKTKNLIETLFSTKNINKITAAFNSLSPKEKQIVLSEEKVKERLYKIADAYFLITILIDLPYSVRNTFLQDINRDKFSKEENILINFLLLSNYEDFDYHNLANLTKIKDKQIINLIFRKLSSEKLKDIILANYQQFINDFAFLEYSKRTKELNLELAMLNILEENTLVSELKRRKSRNQITNMDIKDFINISINKQNRIISSSKNPKLIEEVTNAYKEKYASTNSTYKIYCFKNILINYSYIGLIEMQVIVSLLDDEQALELIKLFFKDILQFEDDVEEKYLKSLLYNFRQLNDTTDELYQISKPNPNPNQKAKPKLFAVIHYLNTGIVDLEIEKIFKNKITIEQYQKVNLRKVNKINNLLTKLFKENNDFSEDLTLIFSYKLYMIFGYENTIDLLNFKFGYFDYSLLFKLLYNCNIQNAEFEKVGNSYEPIVNQEFINFLIGDKKDKNTTLKRMLRGELDIIKKEFANLYNNFKRFQTAIGDKIHLNKLLPLLEENPFILLPDEYKLTKDIINNVIKSYKYTDVLPENQTFTVDEKDCIINACEFYHNNLERRVTSSIPRVYGKTEDNYNYEVLKLDDPIIMTLGYQTGCCFRLNGQSKEFLQYCSKSPYGRVIIIKNEKNEICSMIPIIRNGNVINGNSIERNSKGDAHKIYNALKCAFDDILEFSSCYEENPIIACLVTNLHSNCFSSRQIKNNIYPISPEEFYTNYGGNTYIVSSKEGITESDFKLYTPNSIYFDDRPNVLIYNHNMEDSQILKDINKRVQAIHYKLNEPTNERLKYYRYIVCSEDWYLNLDWYGISGKCLEKDPRAIEEYNAVKTYLEKKFNDENIYSINYDDDDLSGEGISSILPKKLTFEDKNTKKEV